MLTKDRQEQIKNTTKDLLLKYGFFNDQNIDIVKLATSLGFAVLLLKEEAKADGVILVNKDNKPILPGKIKASKIIAFKKTIERNKNRFIIAHELGHFFLHSNNTPTPFFAYQYNGVENNTDALSEEEANYFAANLLVPEDKLVEAIKTFKEPISEVYVVEELAKTFEVDTSCIRKRFEEVGISLDEK